MIGEGKKYFDVYLAIEKKYPGLGRLFAHGYGFYTEGAVPDREIRDPSRRIIRPFVEEHYDEIHHFDDRNVLRAQARISSYTDNQCQKPCWSLKCAHSGVDSGVGTRNFVAELRNFWEKTPEFGEKLRNFRNLE